MAPILASIGGTIVTAISSFLLAKLPSILIAIGFSFVSYKGIDVLFNYVLENMRESLGEIGTIHYLGQSIDAIGIVSAAGVFSALNIVLSGYSSLAAVIMLRKAFAFTGKIMLNLITGLPGNGKTLFTIDYVRKLAKKEGRQVYYYGIPELSDSLGWQLLENPEEWHLLPDGAIIVMDEAQKVFRPSRDTRIPPFVEALETHRHHGHDLFLITQHPSLVCTHVRRLAGSHRHIVRMLGTSRATVHEWPETNAECEKRRTDSSKTIFKYPKDVYKLYKSATQHTHKVQIPSQVYWLIGVVVFILFLIVRVAGHLQEYKSPGGQSDEELILNSSAEVPHSGGALPSMNASALITRPMTEAEYLDSFIPRMDGLPHTAPRYDEVTRPVTAPRIVGCVSFKSRCQCYTQRGTKVSSPDIICRSVIASGVPFYDWIPDVSQGRGSDGFIRAGGRAGQGG